MRDQQMQLLRSQLLRLEGQQQQLRRQAGGNRMALQMRDHQIRLLRGQMQRLQGAGPAEQRELRRKEA
eukprot:gene14265-17135_t